MNKRLKVADWARMFYDIDCVKKRVLLGELPLRWRNLPETEKEKLCQTLADTLKVFIGEKPVLNAPYVFYSNDAQLLANWREIVDLNKYGIFLNEERPETNMQM